MKFCCISAIIDGANRTGFSHDKYHSRHFKGYQKVVDKLSVKREKIADIQKALATADVNQDSKLDFEEWRTELKS